MKLLHPSLALVAALSLVGFAQAEDGNDSCCVECCDCECVCDDAAEPESALKEGDCDKGECERDSEEEPTALAKEGDCDKGGCERDDADE